MSFKAEELYPCVPATVRGESTKLSSHKDKLVYTNGRVVVIRDLKNPKLAIINAGHVQNATVARISPSGYYCASADVSGTVRIWDTVGEDQTLKAEYKVLPSRIKDLAWDGESKRIIAVGEGRDKFGHAFMMDTGSSTGDVMGHSKVINAVAIRHQRPYRAATASDDTTIVFHQGPPYKFDKVLRTHTKFVQDIRYAPSGDHFASVGADAKIFVYDGKTGDVFGEITNSPHGGSIMACSWSPDSKELVTSSADRTVKLWDIETRKSVLTWTLGSDVKHQQVGNAWTEGGDIVSLSMNGDLNIFDKRVGDKPARILYGPQKSITAAAPTASGTIYTGTADGRVLSFSGSEFAPLEGTSHSTMVVGLVSTPEGKAFSVGYDDRVREIEGNAFVPAVCETSAQPKSMAIADDSTLFVAEVDGVDAIRSNQKLLGLKTRYGPTSVTASKSLVAVGGDDQKVYLYDWDGKALKESGTLEGLRGSVSALAISPDGALLAAGDSGGKIILFDLKERKTVTSRWSFHSGRINSLSWTADSQHCASGSLDTHIYIWSVQKPIKNIAIKSAIPGGVNTVFWCPGENGKLVGVGADGCLRKWSITFHA